MDSTRGGCTTVWWFSRLYWPSSPEHSTQSSYQIWVSLPLAVRRHTGLNFYHPFPLPSQLVLWFVVFLRLGLLSLKPAMLLLHCCMYNDTAKQQQCIDSTDKKSRLRLFSNKCSIANAITKGLNSCKWDLAVFSILINWQNLFLLCHCGVLCENCWEEMKFISDDSETWQNVETFSYALYDYTQFIYCRCVPKIHFEYISPDAGFFYTEIFWTSPKEAIVSPERKIISAKIQNDNWE